MTYIYGIIFIAVLITMGFTLLKVKKREKEIGKILIDVKNMKKITKILLGVLTVGIFILIIYAIINKEEIDNIVILIFPILNLNTILATQIRVGEKGILRGIIFIPWHSIESYSIKQFSIRKKQYRVEIKYRSNKNKKIIPIIFHIKDNKEKIDEILYENINERGEESKE